MKTKSYLAILAAFSFLLSSRAAEPIPIASPEAVVNAPEFKNLSDLKWDKILPDLGADSPEITHSPCRSKNARDQSAHSHAESDPRSQALARRQ
jgi:hypothetical protein